MVEANSNEAEQLIELKKVTALFDEAKGIMKEVEAAMEKCSFELKSLSDEKSALVKKAEAKKLEIKKLAIQVAKYEKEQVNAERIFASMLQKHAWIESEKEAFGVPGGDYDFEKSDPVEMSSMMKRLKEEQTSLVRVPPFCMFSTLEQDLNLDSHAFVVSLNYIYIAFKFRPRRSTRKLWECSKKQKESARN